MQLLERDKALTQAQEQLAAMTADISYSNKVRIKDPFSNTSTRCIILLTDPPISLRDTTCIIQDGGSDEATVPSLVPPRRPPRGAGPTLPTLSSRVLSQSQPLALVSHEGGTAALAAMYQARCEALEYELAEARDTLEKDRAAYHQEMEK